MRPTANSAVRHVPQSLAIIGTTRGRVRAENQDKAITATYGAERAALNFRAYVVCDGLGGMQEGERCASEAAANFLLHLVSTAGITDRKSRLQRAVEFTNRELCQQFQERGGSTLAAILFTDSGATAISVGDTRIYKHGDKGELTQLTVDDTIAARLAELQESAAPAVARGPFANHLTQFIGQHSDVVAQIVESGTLLNGSAQPISNNSRIGLLMTTDGVHRMGSETFDALARGAGSAREMVARLMSLSDWLGGADNATAMYISFADPSNRANFVKAHQGLQIHDAHGELTVVPLAIEPLPTHVQRQWAVAEAPLAGPTVPRPMGADPTPPKQSDRPKAEEATKNKGKGRRGQVRKRRAAGKDEESAQPELDIKVTQHSE
jgi:serine/threonine protein phosphatase PrpC